MHTVHIGGVPQHYVTPDALFKYDLFFSLFNSSII